MLTSDLVFKRKLLNDILYWTANEQYILANKTLGEILFVNGVQLQKNHNIYPQTMIGLSDNIFSRKIIRTSFYGQNIDFFL